MWVTFPEKPRKRSFCQALQQVTHIYSLNNTNYNSDFKAYFLQNLLPITHNAVYISKILFAGKWSCKNLTYICWDFGCVWKILVDPINRIGRNTRPDTWHLFCTFFDTKLTPPPMTVASCCRTWPTTATLSCYVHISLRRSSSPADMYSTYSTIFFFCSRYPFPHLCNLPSFHIPWRLTLTVIPGFILLKRPN